MHQITVTGHEPGDYLHPDQKVEVIDEATGRKYSLYLRSNAMAPTESGEVSLFVPIEAIKAIQADKAYCVLTLSPATTAREVAERRKRLTLLSVGRRTQPRLAAAKRTVR